MCVRGEKKEGESVGEEAKEKRTDKVGLALSECHVEGRWKFSCSETERHPRILRHRYTCGEHQILLVSLALFNPRKQMNDYF